MHSVGLGRKTEANLIFGIVHLLTLELLLFRADLILPFGRAMPCTIDRCKGATNTPSEHTKKRETLFETLNKFNAISLA